VGVGGEAEPVAEVYGNRAGLLALREQLGRALGAEEGLASQAAYRETDERRLDLFVRRAHKRGQMGAAPEPERPDRSVFA
jgi:hypothetical protein